jgi:hypothetical protein
VPGFSGVPLPFSAMILSPFLVLILTANFSINELKIFVKI